MRSTGSSWAVTLLAATLAFVPSGPARSEGGQPAGQLRVNRLISFKVKNAIQSCALSPDGRKLLVGQNGFRLAMYDLTNLLRASSFGEVWAVANWNGEPLSSLFVALSPDGRTAAAGSIGARQVGGTRVGGLVEVRDAASGVETFHATEHKGGIWAVEFSPDGKTLATGDSEHTVLLWDWKKRAVRTRLTNHSGQVCAVAFSPDGRTIATAATDLTIRFWRTDTGQEVRMFMGLKDTVLALAWSPDGRQLASAGHGGDLKIWDVATGEPNEFAMGAWGKIMGMAWSPDGRILATAGINENNPEDNKTAVMVLWDTRTGFPAETVGTDGFSANTSGTGKYFDVSFSRDGRVLAGVGQNGDGAGHVAVWYLGGWEKAPSDAPAAGGPFRLMSPSERARQHFDAGYALFYKHYSPDRLADAERELRLALAGDPAIPQLRTTLGGVLYHQQKYPDAEEQFLLAIRQEPNSAMLHNCLADALDKQQKYADAEMEEREALRLEPNMAAWHRRLAWYLRIQGKSAEALAELNGALRIDPKCADIYCERAWTHLAAGNGAAALADGRAYLDLKDWREPLSPYAALPAYLGARQAKRGAEATRLLDEYAAKGDTTKWPYPVVRYFRSEITSQQLLEQATDNGKQTEAHAYYGMDLSLSGKKDEALPHLRWVLENGNKEFSEYPLARAEYARLGGAPITK